MADRIHEEDPASVHGMAISPNSKNYERTLLMLDLFSTDVDYSDLFVFGIKGDHWEPVGDTKYQLTPNSASYPMNEFNCWGFYAPESNRAPDNIPDEVSYPVKMTEWVEEDKISRNPVVGFSFNDTNVQNEMALCGELAQTAGVLLLIGKSNDLEADVAKYKEQLKNAGIDAIQEEVQRQLTAYMNAVQ
jgi:putative aldouronate transport system substrate-binding protein